MVVHKKAGSTGKSKSIYVGTYLMSMMYNASGVCQCLSMTLAFLQFTFRWPCTILEALVFQVHGMELSECDFFMDL